MEETVQATPTYAQSVTHTSLARNELEGQPLYATINSVFKIQQLQHRVLLQNDAQQTTIADYDGTGSCFGPILI